MDYHDSSAGNARLAVAKYAATASKKLGSIFFNPGSQIHSSILSYYHQSVISTGGPGGSGIEAVSDLGKEVSELSHGSYDFISWDPRGVGYTTCDKLP